MSTVFEDLLTGHVKALGLAVPEGAIETAGRHARLIQKWQKRVRLVGTPSDSELAETHFADSWLLEPFVAPLWEGGRVVDIGSGAGFPGLALALLYPQLDVCLVESDHRKAAFLKAVVGTVGLRPGSVSVVVVKALGDPDGEQIERADLVVSRALTDLDRWLPLARKYVVPGGRVLAMLGGKAPDDVGLLEAGESCGLELETCWRGALPVSGARRAIASWVFHVEH